ncbi:hypothetical protein F511_19517 [Dorcoceras hygrometricum]|uniref:Uncharacterized protein n=1 Tax=Dorcoceras hygrometricum TaxID=472368 RepID=A0A2Z7B8T1_9LAMI|nr:hypothetical protein F511_19517 [Dorcoceras hygrometricum]
MRKLLLTNLLAVAIISTVDESINSRYSKKKNRKLELELERRRSAGALSVDDISSDVIIQQEATVISRKIQQMRRDALDME